MLTSSDSDSSRQTISSVQRVRQYRFRARQGSSIRHPATDEERLLLLNTPYKQLSASQRRRAQRYRQQLRRQTDTAVVDTLHYQQQQQVDISASSSRLTPNIFNQSHTPHVLQQAQLVASRFPPSQQTTSSSHSIFTESIQHCYSISVIILNTSITWYSIYTIIQFNCICFSSSTTRSINDEFSTIIISTPIHSCGNGTYFILFYIIPTITIHIGINYVTNYNTCSTTTTCDINITIIIPA